MGCSGLGLKAIMALDFGLRGCIGKVLARIWVWRGLLRFSVLRRIFGFGIQLYVLGFEGLGASSCLN